MFADNNNIGHLRVSAKVEQVPKDIDGNNLFEPVEQVFSEIIDKIYK